MQPEETKKKPAQSSQQDVSIQTPVAPPQARTIAPMSTQQPETELGQTSAAAVVNQGGGVFQTNSCTSDSNTVLLSSSLSDAMHKPIDGVAGSLAQAAARLLPSGTATAATAPSQTSALTVANRGGGSSNTNSYRPDSSSPTDSSLIAAAQMPVSGLLGTELQTPTQLPPAGSVSQAKIIAPIGARQLETAPGQTSTPSVVKQGGGLLETNSYSPDSTIALPTTSSSIDAVQIPVGGRAATEAQAATQLPPVGVEAAPISTQTINVGAAITATSKDTNLLDALSAQNSSPANNSSLNDFKLPAKGNTEVKVANMQTASIPVTEKPAGTAKDSTSAATAAAKPEPSRTSVEDNVRARGEASANSSNGSGDNATATTPAMMQSNLTSASNLFFASSNSELQAAISSKVAQSSNESANLSPEGTVSLRAGLFGKGKGNSTDQGLTSTPDASSSSTTQSTPATVPLNGKLAEAAPIANPDANAAKDMGGAAVIAQAAQSSQGAVPSHPQQAAQSSAAPNGTAAQGQVSTGASSLVDTTPSLSSAQLIQSMHHSEMRVGMQSDEFGNISISTSLNHQALSAQISIDHSELSRALAVHLPSIEEKLGNAYGVQARVEVRDAANSNTSSYSDSGQQSKEDRQSRGGTTSGSIGVAAERMSALTSSVTNSVAASTSRLDIRI